MLSQKLKFRTVLHKNEIIDTLTQKLGVTKSESSELLNTILGFIQKKLQKGYRVQLSPFGVFSRKSNKKKLPVKESSATPQLKKNTHIVIFKPGKDLEKRG